MILFKKLILGTLFVYLSCLILLYFFQDRVVFIPTKLPPDYKFDFKADYKEGFLESRTGHKLHYLNFKQTSPRASVIYFHGNGGALDSWGYFASKLSRKLNVDVWLMDYPGFGKSSPGLARSGDELVQIGKEFVDLVRGEIEEKQKLVLFGRSLGSGVASGVAIENNVDGVILETPYYSTMRLALDMYKVIPTFLLKFRLNNSKLSEAQLNKILILHGKSDRMIPYQHSIDLQKAFGRKSQMISILEGSHNDLPLFDEYWLGLEGFFEN